jgi:hypothetical protein
MTHYTFTLDNGLVTNAGETSVIYLPDGTTKAPADVVVGDRIAPIHGVSAVVTNIATQEV